LLASSYRRPLTDSSIGLCFIFSINSNLSIEYNTFTCSISFYIVIGCLIAVLKYLVTKKQVKKSMINGCIIAFE